MESDYDLMARRSEHLRSIPAKYAQPDPSTISKLPKGGTTLDYVGHAEITLALLDVDPLWTWEPTGYDDETGGPKIHKQGNRLVMWGWLEVAGHRRLCVGTCEERKGDPEKELIGDLLRNGAMRFGIGTKLWSKVVDADPAGSGAAGGYDRPAARTGVLQTHLAPSKPGTTPAMKRMMALMNEAGLVERASRLAFTSDAVGRTIETASDLTAAEIATVCKALEANIPAQDPTEGAA